MSCESKAPSNSHFYSYFSIEMNIFSLLIKLHDPISFPETVSAFADLARFIYLILPAKRPDYHSNHC